LWHTFKSRHCEEGRFPPTKQSPLASWGLLREEHPRNDGIEKNMKRELLPCVYIMTNKYNKVLYTGVTSNVLKRVNEHKEKLIGGFTSRYNVTKMVYYEEYETMPEAIAREKQIKGGSRQKKIDLINSKNPEWKDLYDEFFA
jgi:putative endonuclease